MNNNGFISYQIAVYKTNKKLVEFNDKLNAAPFDKYAHIHARADEAEDGKKIYSNIGVVLQDYSNGTGNNIVRVTANISPDEAQYIFSRVQACVETFDFNSEKIFGVPDGKGYSEMTKLRITRASADKDGNVRNYPWYIMIENGKGISAKAATGGTYCQSGSYICVNKGFINLNDLDFFKLMNRVSSYINVWEIVNGSILLRKAKTAVDIDTVASKNCLS